MNVSERVRTMLESITGYGERTLQQPDAADRGAKFGTIDASFDGTTAGARIIFDGEPTAGLRSYPWVGDMPVAGQRVMLMPAGRSYVIVGALGQALAYPRPFRMAAGRVAAPSLANGSSADTTITWGAGPGFTVPPLVILTGETTRAVWQVTTDSTTLTGCVARQQNYSGGNSSPSWLRWVAVQMRPGAADG